MKSIDVLPTIFELCLGDDGQLWSLERLNMEAARCVKLVAEAAKEGQFIRHSEISASLRSSADGLICVIQLVKPPPLPIFDVVSPNDIDWEAQFLSEKEKIVKVLHEAISAFDGWKLHIAQSATAPFLDSSVSLAEDELPTKDYSPSLFAQFLMDGGKSPESTMRLPGGDWRQASFDGFELITWKKERIYVLGRAERTAHGVKLELLGEGGSKPSRRESVHIRFAGLSEKIREHVDRQCQLHGKVRLIGRFGVFTGAPATRYFLPDEIATHGNESYS